MIARDVTNVSLIIGDSAKRRRVWYNAAEEGEDHFDVTEEKDGSQIGLGSDR